MDTVPGSANAKQGSIHGPGPAPRAVAAIAVLVAGLALAAALGLRAAAPGESGALAAHQVHVGDSVVAAGLVVSTDGGRTFTICVVAGSRLMPNELPGCSAIAAPVVGITASEIPGWIEREGLGYSTVGVPVGPGSDQNIVVRGRWLGDAIQAESVAVANRQGAVRYPMPCRTPVGGWEPRPPSGVEGESLGRALYAEVSGHPELYGGLWRAYPAAPGGFVPPDPTDLGDPIMVVGTIGDVATVQRQLAEIYPFALCVTEVGFSAAELVPVAERLALPDRTWVTEVQADLDRVRVSIAVLDSAALERIGGDTERVIVEPLVRRD